MGVYGFLEEEKSTGLKTENPSPCVVTHLLNIGGKDYETRERHAKELARDINNKVVQIFTRLDQATSDKGSGKWESEDGHTRREPAERTGFAFCGSW